MIVGISLEVGSKTGKHLQRSSCGGAESLQQPTLQQLPLREKAKRLHRMSLASHTTVKAFILLVQFRRALLLKSSSKILCSHNCFLFWQILPNHGKKKSQDAKKLVLFFGFLKKI
jgi:hypothetical protein